LLTRRRFNRNVALASLAATTAGNRMHAETQPETIHLQANGWMPNNPKLPVLFYKAALDTKGGAASKCEALFTRNGWPPQWRNGVYTFHHYHSTTHEVLGFTRGEARLVLGGEGGREFHIRAGDVLLLPTGTGHCELTCSPDFQVIGAYPPGCHWDICRAAPDTAALERMATMALPASDPVHGTHGPLTLHWRA